MALTACAFDSPVAISMIFLERIIEPIPIVMALVGISVGSLLGGSAIVESIFNWPGVGNLSVSAIGSRDYAVVQGYALLMALVYLVVNWAIGFLQRRIDPRIGKGGA